nr:hypothetical protein [Tanacetum cinerariifolium]
MDIRRSLLEDINPLKNELLSFLNFILQLNQLNQVVVIASGFNSCVYVYDSSLGPTIQRVETLVHILEEFVSKDEELNMDDSVDGSGYVAIMNSIFSAQRSMASTPGWSVPVSNNSIFNIFAFSQFLTDPEAFWCRFPCFVFLSQKTIELGYICSVCLSTFCQHYKKCSTCGQATSAVQNTLRKEKVSQDIHRPASNAAMREYHDRNYHQLLPIIAKKVHQEKVQQEMLKAVKACLNFKEISQHSESGTPSKRRDLKKRLRSRRIRGVLGSPEPRRDRPESLIMDINKGLKSKQNRTKPSIKQKAWKSQKSTKVKATKSKSQKK